MSRTVIEPHKGDKRYVRRKKGKFTKSQDDVGAPSLQTGVSTPRRRSKAVKVTGAIDVDRDSRGVLSTER